MTLEMDYIDRGRVKTCKGVRQGLIFGRSSHYETKPAKNRGMREKPHSSPLLVTYFIGLE